MEHDDHISWFQRGGCTRYLLPACADLASNGKGATVRWPLGLGHLGPAVVCLEGSWTDRASDSAVNCLKQVHKNNLF